MYFYSNLEFEDIVDVIVKHDGGTDRTTGRDVLVDSGGMGLVASKLWRFGSKISAKFLQKIMVRFWFHRGATRFHKLKNQRTGTAPTGSVPPKVGTKTGTSSSVPVRT